MIPLTYESPIQQQLRPGEQLLWVGRPRQGFMLRGWDSLLVVFGIAWAGVTVRWAIDAAGWAAGALGWIVPHAPPRVFHGVIVAGGLALFINRFYVDARRRAAMWYALTDRRILFVLVAAKQTSVAGIEYHELKDVQLVRPSADGSGTIRFTRGTVDPYAESSDVMNAHAAPGAMFEAIPAARDVYELMDRTRSEAVKKRMELMRKGFDADIRAGYGGYVPPDAQRSGLTGDR